VSKWKTSYEKGGTSSLHLAYRGKSPYLTQEQQEDVLKWIADQKQVSMEGLRDHIEQEYDVVYRSKQSYYGAINLLTQQVHLKPFSAGNGENTVKYVQWLQQLYLHPKLWLLWDGASYHGYAEIRDYLAEINTGLAEEQWKVTCILFARNVPEQNPVEDLWLIGKNWLRKRFAFHKTFAEVKHCFFDFLNNTTFFPAKFLWYYPELYSHSI